MCVTKPVQLPIVRKYVFYVFKIQKRDFLRFLKCYAHVKTLKKAERVIQVSFQSTAVLTLLHFEIADTFAVKQLHTIIHTTYTVSGKTAPLNKML